MNKQDVWDAICEAVGIDMAVGSHDDDDIQIAAALERLRHINRTFRIKQLVNVPAQSDDEDEDN